jgi:hypothetical protein
VDGTTIVRGRVMRLIRTRAGVQIAQYGELIAWRADVARDDGSQAYLGQDYIP